MGEAIGYIIGVVIVVAIIAAILLSYFGVLTSREHGKADQRRPRTHEEISGKKTGDDGRR
jgi:hypothetical protein